MPNANLTNYQSSNVRALTDIPAEPPKCQTESVYLAKQHLFLKLKTSIRREQDRVAAKRVLQFLDILESIPSAIVPSRLIPLTNQSGYVLTFFQGDKRAELEFLDDQDVFLTMYALEGDISVHDYSSTLTFNATEIAANIFQYILS
jgi:hypothetical protein